MKTRIVLALLLVAVPPLVWAEDPLPADDSSFTMTDGLKSMLDARDEHGMPVLDEKLRKDFDALPSHARKLFADAVGSEYIGSAGQIREILSLDLDTTNRIHFLPNYF